MERYVGGEENLENTLRCYLPGEQFIGKILIDICHQIHTVFFYVVKFFSSIRVCKYCTATFCANTETDWHYIYHKFYAALSSTNIISLTNVKRSDKCNMALLTLHLSPLVASLLASHWIYFCAQNIDLFIYLTECRFFENKINYQKSL